MTPDLSLGSLNARAVERERERGGCWSALSTAVDSAVFALSGRFSFFRLSESESVGEREESEK